MPFDPSLIPLPLWCFSKPTSTSLSLSKKQKWIRGLSFPLSPSSIHLFLSTFSLSSLSILSPLVPLPSFSLDLFPHHFLSSPLLCLYLSFSTPLSLCLSPLLLLPGRAGNSKPPNLFYCPFSSSHETDLSRFLSPSTTRHIVCCVLSGSAPRHIT